MRILVTAGPTREHIDDVRFLSSPSSGRMGWAVAEEAARRGHEVVLVAGPVDLPDPSGVEVRRVVSALEMHEACLAACPDMDAVVMTAGTGKTPTMSDKVMLNYLGTTVAGTVFVDTYSAGTPVTYNMSDLIAGWQEALLKMQEGAEWGLYVPPQLAQVRAATKPHTSVLEPGFYLIKLLKVIEG